MYYSPEKDQVYATHSEIRVAHSNVLFPVSIGDDDLEFIGVHPLVYEAPDVEAHQIAETTTVENIDGQWVQQWLVRDRTPEEMPEDPPTDPQ